MKGKQRVYIAISVGPIAHLGETEIPSVRSNLLGFLAVAMSTELGGSRYEISVGPSWTFWFGTYVDMRK